MKKRIISVVLAVVMLLSMIPLSRISEYTQMLNLAQAASGSEDTLLKSLGLNDSAVDLDPYAHPYGTGAASMFTKNELILTDTISKGNTVKIKYYDYDQAASTGANILECSSGEKTGKANAYGGAPKASVSVAFDPRNLGRKGAIASVSYSESNGKLFYYLTVDFNKYTGGVLQTINLGSLSSTTLPNPWEINSYISITAGDYNGDGYEEIAVYTPINRLIRIYEYNANTPFEPMVEKLRRTPPGNNINGISPVVHLTSGNVDNDGADELIVTRSNPHVDSNTTSECMPITTIISCSKDDSWNIAYDAKFEHAWDIKDYNKTDTAGTQISCYGACVVGDVDGDGKNELVLAGYDLATDERGNPNTNINKNHANIGLVEYNNATKSYEKGAGGVGHFVKINSNISAGLYGYERQSPIAVACFNPTGNGGKDYIMVGGSIFLLNTEGDKTTAPYSPPADHPARNYSFDCVLEPNGENGIYGQSYQQNYDGTPHNHSNIWITSSAVGNFINDTNFGEQLVMMVGRKKSGDENYRYDGVQITFDATSGNFKVSRTACLEGVGTVWSYKVTYDPKNSVKGHMHVVSSDLDQDSVILKLRKSEAYFSDPNVVAVLQAAPYFGDLTTFHPDYSRGGSTAYGRISGTGESKSHGFTVSSSIIAGYEQDISILGFKIGGVDYEAEITASMGKEYTESKEKTFTTEYAATSLDDNVILSMTPYVRYVYNMTVPSFTLPTQKEYDEQLAKLVDGSEEEKAYINEMNSYIEKGYTYGDKTGVQTVTYVVCVPEKPRMSMITVTEYDRIANLNSTDSINPIRGNVLDSIVGQPATYDSNPQGLSEFEGATDIVGEDAGADNSNYSWVAKHNGSVTQSFETRSETSSTLNWSAGASMKVVGNVAGVKAGVGMSADYTGSSTDMSFESTYCAGTVSALPMLDENLEGKYDFSWRFGSWLSDINNSQCLVLGYVVKDVKQPYSFPKNLSIKETTADSITINWTRGAGELVEIFMVTENDASPYFLVDRVNSAVNEYTVKNLTPNTKYTFALRATDQAGINAGPISTTVSGITNHAPGANAPSIAQIPDVYSISGADIYLIADATAYNNGSLRYQWQEQVIEKEAYTWKNIYNEIDHFMTIADADESYNGKKYRCEVSQLIGGKVVYSYSNGATIYIGLGGTSTAFEIDRDYGTAEGSYYVENTETVTESVAVTVMIGENKYNAEKISDGRSYLIICETEDVFDETEVAAIEGTYLADEETTKLIEEAAANNESSVTIDPANLIALTSVSEYATEQGVSTGIPGDVEFTTPGDAVNNTIVYKETIYIEDENNPESVTEKEVETVVEYSKIYTEGTKTIYLAETKEEYEGLDENGETVKYTNEYTTYYYIDEDEGITSPVKVTVQHTGYVDENGSRYPIDSESTPICFDLEREETVYNTTVVPGDAVTLSAVVESLSMGVNHVPAGTVKFNISLNNSDMLPFSLSGTLEPTGTDNQAKASVTWTPSKAGTYTITATYLGQDGVLRSSDSESKTYDAYDVNPNGDDQSVKSFLLDCGDSFIVNTANDLAPTLRVTTVKSTLSGIESVEIKPLSLADSDDITYSVTMRYSDAPEGNYTFDGNTFTATVTGTYFITATYTDSEDGKIYSHTKEIDVTSTVGEQQPIYFGNTSMTVYANQGQVTNTLSNFNAGSTVTYKSTDEAVATVDENGVVTVLKSGTANITATSKVIGKEDVHATYTLHVIKKPVSVSIPDGITVTYGQTAEEALEIIKTSGIVVMSNGAVVDNMTFGDITGIENDTPDYTTNYKAGSGIGRYPVNIENVVSDKYEVTAVTGYFDVVRKEIGSDDIEAVNVEAKDYDGSTDAKLTVVFKDGIIVKNDVVSAEAIGEFETSDAGENKLVSYQITGLSGANSGNYVLSDNTSGISNGTINKAPISITLPATTSVVYDGEIKSVNVLAYSNGLYYNDFTVRYVDENGVSTQSPVNVGKYNVIVELADPENYTIKNSCESTLVIKSATQDVFTIEGIPDTVTYGDRFEIQTAGAQAGGTITYEVTGTDKDGNPADIAELETTDGKTYIRITGMGTVILKATSSLANYNDKTAMITFTVGKRIIGVKVTPVARTYNGKTDVDINVELVGLLEGDEGITATASGILATPDAGKSKTVFVSDIALSDDSKYQPAITSTQANVDIEKLVISGFEITAEDKVFDKTTAAKATVIKVNDVLDADKDYVTVNGIAEFDTKDRGENKTVTFTATGLSGDLSSNYVLADNAKTATCTASIVAASSKDLYISGYHSGVSVGERFTLRAHYDNEVAEAVWSSSNEKVATVNAQTGEVTVVGAGSAIIYAAIDEGYGIVPAEFPLNSSKKTIQLYAEPEELIKVYTGKVQIPEILSPDEGFVPDDNNVKLKFICESGADTEFEEPINAGKYKIYYEIIDNEFSGTGYLDFVINKGKIVVKAADAEKIYGASAKYVPVIVEGEHIENAYNEVKSVIVYTCEGEPATASVGEYDINVSLTAAENDNIRFYVDKEIGKLTVKSAPLTLTVKDVVREFGFENETPEYEYSGFVNGEDVSVLTGELTFKYDNSVTSESPIGEYEDVIVADSLATGSNYDLTVVYSDGIGADLSIVKVSVETITAPLDGINDKNVNSDHRETINEVIEELKSFTPDNDEERKKLNDAVANCNNLLNRINTAEAALNEIEINTDILNEKRATKFWENDIKAFLDKVNALLENSNLTQEEFEKLIDYKEQAESLIETINSPLKYFSMRIFYLILDLINWMRNGITGIIISNAIVL